MWNGTLATFCFYNISYDVHHRTIKDNQTELFLSLKNINCQTAMTEGAHLWIFRKTRFLMWRSPVDIKPAMEEVVRYTCNSAGHFTTERTKT